MQAKRLFAGRSHDRNKDLGVLKIARDLGAGDSYIPHPRILQIEQNSFAGDFANHFTHARKAVSFHETPLSQFRAESATAELSRTSYMGSNSLLTNSAIG